MSSSLLVCVSQLEGDNAVPPDLCNDDDVYAWRPPQEGQRPIRVYTDLQVVSMASPDLAISLSSDSCLLRRWM